MLKVGVFSFIVKMRVSMVVSLFGLVVAAHAVQFKIKNNAGGEVWIGIQGNPGHPHLENGGFKLGQGQQKDVNAPDNWAGRFWARTWCDGGSNHCQTGDCGSKVECNGAGGAPPATLIEITLKGSGGQDFYDISLVDGYNLKASIQPQGGQGDGSQYSCKRAGCDKEINSECPDELKLKNSQGQVIGCKSACLAKNTDEYCCRNAHDKPETCKSSDWPVNYAQQFKNWCPDAYSYAYDDHKSTFTCKNVPVYLLTFG